MTLLKAVFYRSETIVQEGDEFYQIELKHQPDISELPFLIEIYHGVAGSPRPASPRLVPERAERFQTESSAREKFDLVAADIEGKDFNRYIREIHGDRGFVV